MKKWIKGILTLIVVMVGVLGFGVQASANKYTPIPKSIRGTWYSIENNYLGYRFTIKKYTVETESMKPSGFISDRSVMRIKRNPPTLFVSKKRTKHGYWIVGMPNALRYGVKKGAKDSRGFSTLKMHSYYIPAWTDTLYSKKSLKSHVKALNEKNSDSFDDFMVDFDS